MTVEEKIGQMFILGFRGTNMSFHLMKTVANLKPGAFILYKKNIKTIQQIFSLNRKIQEASYRQINLPMLLMIDQEGGSVKRESTYHRQSLRTDLTLAT